MCIVRTKPLAQCNAPREALSELLAGFEGADDLLHDCEEVTGGAMPLPFRELLAHKIHMTRILKEHYAAPVHLHVMERHVDGDLYSRKILLTAGPGGPIVEYGLVRLNFRYMAPEVGSEIREGQTPLGAILMAHQVLRRIEPRWYMRFAASSAMMRWFGADQSAEAYGRIGTIYCNGEPAIELLEIVTGAPRPA